MGDENKAYNVINTHVHTAYIKYLSDGVTFGRERVIDLFGSIELVVGQMRRNYTKQTDRDLSVLGSTQFEPIKVQSLGTVRHSWI